MLQNRRLEKNCISKLQLIQQLGDLVILEGEGVVEIFKTNVIHWQRAEEIVVKILENWPDLKVNFDLEDCDNILRVEAKEGEIDVEAMEKFLIALNVQAEVLE